MKILHISDTHIYEEPHKKLCGVLTRDTLLNVLEIARHGEAFDLIIATGDLSMDGSIDSYKWLREQLNSLKVPYYVLPGNHDNFLNLRSVFDLSEKPYPKLINLRNWKILLLDTQKKGAVYGSLDKIQLERLENFLKRDVAKKTAIFMHHPAVEVGCDWLDKINLREGKECFMQLTQSYQVELIVAGHVHQESQFLRGETCFLTSPSTCAQFKPQSFDFAVDNSPPGFRVIEFTDENSFHTSVMRVR